MNILPILIAIGTYTANTGSEGIYFLELNLKNNSSKIITTVAADNPSYLYYLNEKSTLYYVEEGASDKGKINALHYNTSDTTFEKNSTFSTQGNSPCHIAVSPDKKVLVTSNYSSGNFMTYALDASGKIEKSYSHYQFNATSIDTSRQKQSHIHSAFYSPNGQKVYIQDLGGDNIYQFGAQEILKNNQSYTTFKVTPGGGPRHITFSKNNKFVYVLNEINGTIDVCTVDQSGYLSQKIQNIPMDTIAGKENRAAQILLSPDGKQLYASNRGDKNCISVFAVAKNGTLALQQILPSGGKGPRNFTFTADAKHILVANQKSNNIVVFARDEQSGLLKPLNITIDIPSPVCIAVL